MDIVRTSIPVFVDKVDAQQNIRLVRFYFFLVSLPTGRENVELKQSRSKALKDLVGSERAYLVPALSWYASVHTFFLCAALSGTHFNTADDVHTLFDTIYEHDLSLDSEYLSIPFPDTSSKKFCRGQVYRMRLSTLLTLMQSSQRGDLVTTDDLHLSHDETKSFQQWNREVIAGIKKRYESKPENNLLNRTRKK